jgi:hypothetical protein
MAEITASMVKELRSRPELAGVGAVADDKALVPLNYYYTTASPLAVDGLELLAKQLAGEYKVRDGTLRLFYDLARHLMGSFEHCTVAHISRTQNTQADRLAGEAVESRFDTSLKTVSGT